MTNSDLKYIIFVIETLVFISNIAVWLGVYLEQDKFKKETRNRGWRLLVRGLGAETALGALLFIADARLNSREAAALTSQQGLTATAEAHAANATRDAARLGVSLKGLRDFVDAQRVASAASVAALENTQLALNLAIEAANDRLAPRKLSNEQVSEISKQLLQFSGQLYSGMLSTAPDSSGLWKSINNALQIATWNRAPTPDFLGVADNTATMAYDPRTDVQVIAPYSIEGYPESGPSSKVDTAAHALVDALNNCGIKAEFFRNTGKPDHGPEGIVIKIGPKAF